MALYCESGGCYRELNNHHKLKERTNLIKSIHQLNGLHFFAHRARLKSLAQLLDLVIIIIKTHIGRRRKRLNENVRQFYECVRRESFGNAVEKEKSLKCCAD
jgi:hypothetical protein